MTYFTRNQDYPFGVDLSQHNASWDGERIPDFKQFKLHTPEVRFVAMRAGVSWATATVYSRAILQRRNGLDCAYCPITCYIPAQMPLVRWMPFSPS